MKKLFSIIILLVLVVIYRHDIQEYTETYFTPQDKPFAWLDSRRENLFAELPSMEFTQAISALRNFEKAVHDSLRELKQSSGEENLSSKRRLECELAVIYRQVAAQYLQHGDDDNYMQFIQLSQDQLRICHDLQKAEQDI